MSRSGFTIVELITAIALVGILATISIVSYGAWQDRLAENAVIHDLKSAASAMESEKNFGAGYPTSIPDSFRPGEKVTVTYESGDLTSFCLEGQYEASESIFSVTHDSEPIDGECS